MDNLRGMLTGPVIRAIAGIKDLGELILAYVGNPENGPVAEIASDMSDVYVHVIDAMSDLPIIGRLFSPGNIFWRLPKDGDSCMVLRGQDAHGPGVPYVLHGDGATAGTAAVPSWLGPNDCGISSPENFHLDSGNKVLIQDGGQPIARKTDKVGNGTIVFAFSPGSGGATLSVTYTPGDGSSTQSLPSGSGTLTIKELIQSGSSKAECG